MEQHELVALICKLSKVSEQAQNFINVELCGDSAEEQLVADCKKIHAAFFGSRLSLKTFRIIVSDFKKLSQNRKNVAELMRFYVECDFSQDIVAYIRYFPLFLSINEKKSRRHCINICVIRWLIRLILIQGTVAPEGAGMGARHPEDCP